MKNKFERRYYKSPDADYVMFSLYTDEGLTEKGEIRIQDVNGDLKMVLYNDSFGLLAEFKDVFNFSLENSSLEDFIKVLEYQDFKILLL